MVGSTVLSLAVLGRVIEITVCEFVEGGDTESKFPVLVVPNDTPGEFAVDDKTPVAGNEADNDIEDKDSVDPIPGLDKDTLETEVVGSAVLRPEIPICKLVEDRKLDKVPVFDKEILFVVPNETEDKLPPMLVLVREIDNDTEPKLVLGTDSEEMDRVGEVRLFPNKVDETDPREVEGMLTLGRFVESPPVITGSIPEIE